MPIPPVPCKAILWLYFRGASSTNLFFRAIRSFSRPMKCGLRSYGTMNFSSSMVTDDESTVVLSVPSSEYQQQKVCPWIPLTTLQTFVIRRTPTMLLIALSYLVAHSSRYALALVRPSPTKKTLRTLPAERIRGEQMDFTWNSTANGMVTDANSKIYHGGGANVQCAIANKITLLETIRKNVEDGELFH